LAASKRQDADLKSMTINLKKEKKRWTKKDVVRMENLVGVICGFFEEEKFI
jgi:hypothetical protein